MGNTDFTESEKELYQNLMSEQNLTHAEIIDQIFSTREGRIEAASASTPIDAGLGLEAAVKAETAGLSADQRLARLEKQTTIEDALQKSQAAKVAEDQADEKWLNGMLVKAGEKEKPVETLSQEDESWVNRMLGYGGQKNEKV